MVLDLLQPAINLGLSEFDFWEMTVAEIERYIEGQTWQTKLKAQFDYSLANLIGLAFARVQDSKVEFPSLNEAYPDLFPEPELTEEEIAEAEASAYEKQLMEYFKSMNKTMSRKETHDN